MNSASLSQRQVGIEGEHVFLRTLLPDDASERYASWLNDPVVNQYLETRSMTIPKLRAYIGEKWESDQALLLGVFWKETGLPAGQAGAHIGNVKLEPVDLSGRMAMLGLLIGDKEFWGRGVGTEATNLATNFAFKDLGIREMRLGIPCPR